jgi:hypothetical protein
MVGKLLKVENPCLQDMIRAVGWLLNVPEREGGGHMSSCFRSLPRRAAILHTRLTSQQAENYNPKGKNTTGGT